MSFTQFAYGKIRLNADSINPDQQLRVTIPVTNTGSYSGEEVVQLYLQDITASLVRPVRELKAFRKIKLSPGETKEVEFILTANDFSFYQEDLSFKAESGNFNLFIGGSSAATEKATFFLR